MPGSSSSGGVPPKVSEIEKRMGKRFTLHRLSSAAAWPFPSSTTSSATTTPPPPSSIPASLTTAPNGPSVDPPLSSSSASSMPTTAGGWSPHYALPVHSGKFKGIGRAPGGARVPTRLLALSTEDSLPRPRRYSNVCHAAIAQMSHLTHELRQIHEREKLSREEYAAGRMVVEACVQYARSDDAMKKHFARAKKKYFLR